MDVNIESDKNIFISNSFDAYVQRPEEFNDLTIVRFLTLVKFTK